jgi:hypothetical protein
MRELLVIQEQYIEVLEREVTKPLELLRAAKLAMGNYISACRRCTPEKPCVNCASWAKVWDDIDAYLKDNE